MNYELAKRLKDAGFPQEPRVDIGGIDGDFRGGFYFICKRDLNEPSGIAVGEVAPNFLDQRQYADYLNFDGELVKIPQLSELIEACGERFKGLTRHSKDEVIQWGATNGEDCLRFGPTPEEAVARLWLALNKKV